MERKNTHQIFVLFKEFVTVAKQERKMLTAFARIVEAYFSDARNKFCKWLFSEENKDAKVICHIFKVYDSYGIKPDKREHKMTNLISKRNF